LNTKDAKTEPTENESVLTSGQIERDGKKQEVAKRCIDGYFRNFGVNSQGRECDDVQMCKCANVQMEKCAGVLIC
jgi:hypothetical protein